ncbi:sodium:calcium antiporter [Desertibaculum subflavum]|uniref:sodium:calcium antiporter n=1 Tax=Desertibaculum subflavum TaxID=2268458 RepID=UPI000E662E06
MPDFAELGLAANIGIFAAAAVAVWLAGTRIARYADGLSKKLGIGQAVIGLLLLAGVTSLPEIAVTTTAATTGDADLAVNNLLGSIAMQVTVIAVIDLLVSRRAMTAIVPDPSLLLQGTLNVLLLSIAAAGIVVGDIAVLGIGAWAWGCLIAYVASVWVLSQAQGRQPWHATDAERSRGNRPSPRKSGADAASAEAYPLPRLIAMTAAAAAVILVAGYMVERTGSAIAEQTGLGSSFVGFVLVAISTSLPEFSSALSAARLGLFTMAISDILGTNLINIGLIFVTDLLAGGEPVLNRLGSFSIFGALLAIILVAIYIGGVAERRDKAIFRMGIDSLLVLVLYAGGLVLLYTMR